MSLCMCFPLHRPGPPGYWLHFRRVVPPPQSDHWKQLLSEESTHAIRNKNHSGLEKCERAVSGGPSDDVCSCAYPRRRSHGFPNRILFVTSCHTFGLRPRRNETQAKTLGICWKCKGRILASESLYISVKSK